MSKLSIPLEFSLPRYKGKFVGRAAELKWFRSHSKASPLLVVSGAGGEGKTAFTIHVLRHTDQEIVHLAQALLGEDSHACHLAALFALVSAKDQDTLLAALGDHVEDLIVGGHGPSVWQLLEPIRDPSLATFRTRAALASGKAFSVDDLLPPSKDAADALLWADYLMQQGQFETAREYLEGMRDAANLSSEQRTRVMLRSVRVLLHLRRVRCSGFGGFDGRARKSANGSAGFLVGCSWPA